jgi:hypothetical protein
VATAINIGDPLFKPDWTAVTFCRVLIEAKKRFDFEICGLVLDKTWLSFYTKTADGYQLPEIYSIRHENIIGQSPQKIVRQRSGSGVSLMPSGAEPPQRG